MKKGLDFIQHELKETTVKIQAQDYLRKFYSSFGFQAISETYLEDNIPHIDMLLEVKHGVADLWFWNEVNRELLISEVVSINEDLYLKEVVSGSVNIFV